ncbi:MAG: cation diffusion facilitator family transporter [Acidimicrobiia bacterium]|nr:cation diffusion facilitator family transporter [Acidimicrobiia bacterium]MDH4305894.1 cation diffusion facilitator family transporter [Acidimicrobiia bacterium]MDH5292638.1 cation diffusion facilitator family transporter [Acidimicrobiia bacterium]
MATGGGTKAIVAAMAANGSIAVAKFVAYLVTGSASMLAESIHSVADTSNQGLLLLGGKRAKKIADDEHQFGYGRERYFWAFVVALVLFALGGVYSLYEGIEKVRHPHEVSSLSWAIGVLLVAIVAEGLSFRTAIREARPLLAGRSWWQYIRTSRAPELPVVLLEDAGALFGLILALMGVSMAAITGDPIWDGIGTLCIGVLLLVIASVLTFEMRSLLIGEAATPSDIAKMMAAATSAPHVARIIDMKTQHIGPEDLLVAGKIEFDRGMSTSQIADAIDGVEAAIRRVLPHAHRIYLEPDLYDANHVDHGDGAPAH